jgi:hypothetical protein
MELRLKTAEGHFHSGPFLASPSVGAIVLGARTVLFCERIQQLTELNATAALIWQMVTAGGDTREIAKALVDAGVSEADAATFIDATITAWLREGHLIPVAAADQIAAAPRVTQRLEVGPLRIDIASHGDADAPALDGVFGHLVRAGPADAHIRIAIVGQDGSDFLFRDARPLGMCASGDTPAWLKAKLTEALCEHVSDGFLAHGGLVSKRGKRIFVTGAPGAGKSTLVLALAHAGFAFCGDDIVHINNSGCAAGVPFAAAAKPGAWALLRPFAPGIDALPIYRRADAQQVRYITPAARDTNGYLPIDVVLLLERAPAAAARLEPAPPLDALCTILDSGYSKRRGVDTQTVVHLGEHLARGATYRFAYDDLAGAIAAIEARINE